MNVPDFIDSTQSVDALLLAASPVTPGDTMLRLFAFQPADGQERLVFTIVGEQARDLAQLLVNTVNALDAQIAGRGGA